MKHQVLLQKLGFIMVMFTARTVQTIRFVLLVWRTLTDSNRTAGSNLVRKLSVLHSKRALWSGVMSASVRHYVVALTRI